MSIINVTKVNWLIIAAKVCRDERISCLRLALRPFSRKERKKDRRSKCKGWVHRSLPYYSVFLFVLENLHNEILFKKEF